MKRALPILDERRRDPLPRVPYAGTVALVTLGCAKNLVDSEVMLGALVSRGFRPVSDPAEGDLIVVNTCAFLHSAVQEGLDTILELARYRRGGRCRQLVVAGCMVERYREELAQSLPEVDQFISTDELERVGEISTTTEECLSRARRPYFLYDERMPRILSTPPHTAFIKIAEGCNRPCSFCIIPAIRGPFRSRPIESITAETARLLSQGVREFNLVAQDLTNYGSDLTGKAQLVDLLLALDNLPSPRNYWIRLLYAYPIGVSDELIDLLASARRICRYLDIPLQHISHAVLKAMRRPLGERRTRELIEHVRTRAPELALRSTFLVGFPGETEADIGSLERFIREGHFAHLGVFTYSQEEEAAAFHLPDQIPEAVKEERRARIMAAQQDVLRARYRSLIGKRLVILVDGRHSESDLLLSGRTQWQAPETDGEVIISDVADELLDRDGEFDRRGVVGDFVEAEITNELGYDLEARILALEKHR